MNKKKKKNNHNDSWAALMITTEIEDNIELYRDPRFIWKQNQCGPCFVKGKRAIWILYKQSITPSSSDRSSDNISFVVIQRYRWVYTRIHFGENRFLSVGLRSYIRLIFWTCVPLSWNGGRYIAHDHNAKIIAIHQTPLR